MNESVDPVQLEKARPVTLEPVRRHPIRRLLWILAFGVVALLAWQVFDRLETPPAPASRQGVGASAPSVVRVATVGVAPMPVVINALGTVTPLATVTVRSQVSGKLVDVSFREGQTVRAGDALAHVDDRAFQATLAQAKALLEKDTAALAQAQGDLARYQALNRQDSISRQQVDDQAFLVAQDKAATASDLAQIDAANLNISYASIVAPISGRLGFRLVDPGNYVTAGDASGIVVITQMDPISVVFTTAEDNLPAIAQRLASLGKLPVEVRDRGDTKTLATGELTTFDNQIDTSTGTIKLRALFQNAGQTLFPNQFVNVWLTVDTITDSPLAPAAAVQIGSIGSFVYAVNEDSTVSVKKVETGPSGGGKVVIRSGLAAGDKVVIDGVDRLRDGAKVTVVADVPDAGAAGQRAGPGRGTGGQRPQRGRNQTQGAAGASDKGATPQPSPIPQP